MVIQNVSFTVALEARKCPDCGGVYAIANEYVEEARRLGEFKKMWACPYCHTKRGFGEGRIQELEKALSASQTREQCERDQRLAAEREKEKLAKRIANGCCPCCRRNFKNLQRHISAKHPEFNK